MKMNLGMRSDFAHPEARLAAKEKRFQRNMDDKIENLMLCLANFKA